MMGHSMIEGGGAAITEVATFFLGAAWVSQNLTRDPAKSRKEKEEIFESLKVLETLEEKLTSLKIQPKLAFIDICISSFAFSKGMQSCHFKLNLK